MGVYAPTAINLFDNVILFFKGITVSITKETYLWASLTACCWSAIIDDTLYGSDFSVSEENRAAIRRFIDQGGIFSIANGRARNTFAPQDHPRKPCL